MYNTSPKHFRFIISVVRRVYAILGYNTYLVRMTILNIEAIVIRLLDNIDDLVHVLLEKEKKKQTLLVQNTHRGWFITFLRCEIWTNSFSSSGNRLVFRWDLAVPLS